MNKQELPLFFKYWGKSSKEGISYHLLPYHSLDVAAVGYTLLNQHDIYLDYFSRITGMSEEEFIRWFTFFLALHDIGKFADSFQNLRPDILEILQQRTSDRQYVLRHDSLGLILWNKHLIKEFQRRNIVRKSSARYRPRQPIDFWINAVVGHHGQPPKSTPSRRLTRDYFKTRDDFNMTNDFAAVTSFLDVLIPLILGDKELVFPVSDLPSAKISSWWLSGLAVLCDWLGSNTTFFKYKNQQLSLDVYWDEAKKNAETAIQETEILSNAPSSCLTLNDLVYEESGTAPESTPLQKCVANWEIPQTPHIFILEDVTGSGKTEAAVLLAHRLMQAGQGNGLYFALPTMATANTMYSRMRHVYRKLFTDEAVPSLILAHGARDMSEGFRQSIVPDDAPVKNNDYGDETVSAEAHCSAWMADNRKKGFLADIGVGTIDQALLAVLCSRHQSLRLLGLINKILLIDEVHACDAYMHELLCKLLFAHAKAGGSAILLSATLPGKQRQELLNAYAEGREQVDLIDTCDQSYPLVSCLNDQGLREEAVATRQSVKRQVNVEFISDKESVYSLLNSVVAEGQCACWVRNTVRDVIAAYQHIKEHYPNWKVDLFHARYALGDRLNIEKRIVELFNKDSTAESRRGRILLATQVVEQSLDLDFDTLITDLAPVDLIIQRSGRLRRHVRDKAGNRISGKDQRGPVTLHIYSPVVSDSPKRDWYSEFFRYAQKIYKNHGQLWLTANLLKREGQFQMPENARDLIEGVYSDDAQSGIPEALREESNKAEGSSRAEASYALFHALKIECGYTDESANRWQDEAKAPTRLGESTTTVYLAKRQDGSLVPWSSERDYAWQLSAVSMRTYWIDKEVPTEQITNEDIKQCKDALPSRGKWGVLLPLTYTSEGNWQGLALNERGRNSFTYNSKLGLTTN